MGGHLKWVTVGSSPRNTPAARSILASNCCSTGDISPSHTLPSPPTSTGETKAQRLGGLRRRLWVLVRARSGWVPRQANDLERHRRGRCHWGSVALLGSGRLATCSHCWCIIQQRMQPLPWWCFGRCFFPLQVRRAGVGRLVAACPSGNTHSIQVVPTNNLGVTGRRHGSWEFRRSLPRATLWVCRGAAPGRAPGQRAHPPTGHKFVGGA